MSLVWKRIKTVQGHAPSYHLALAGVVTRYEIVAVDRTDAELPYQLQLGARDHLPEPYDQLMPLGRFRSVRFAKEAGVEHYEAQAEHLAGLIADAEAQLASNRRAIDGTSRGTPGTKPKWRMPR